MITQQSKGAALGTSESSHLSPQTADTRTTSMAVVFGNLRAHTQ